MSRFKSETFEPSTPYYRLEARTLCHLPYPTIVMAVPGTIRGGWFNREFKVIRVWNLEAQEVNGVLTPVQPTPVYEQFYRLRDPHQAMRQFVLAINHPKVSERLSFLNNV